MSDIINRVDEKNLKILDLEAFYPEGKRLLFDIEAYLEEGFLLKEKNFRAALKKIDWTVYENAYVGLICSSEAILPAWTFLLVTSYLSSHAKRVILGNKETIDQVLFQDIIETMDVSVFENERVLLKGCSKKPVPETAYVQAVERLHSKAKAILYGEACSMVPLYKQKRR